MSSQIQWSSASRSSATSARRPAERLSQPLSGQRAARPLGRVRPAASAPSVSRPYRVGAGALPVSRDGWTSVQRRPCVPITIRLPPGGTTGAAVLREPDSSPAALAPGTGSTAAANSRLSSSAPDSPSTADGTRCTGAVGLPDPGPGGLRERGSRGCGGSQPRAPRNRVTRSGRAARSATRANGTSSTSPRMRSPRNGAASTPVVTSPTTATAPAASHTGRVGRWASDLRTPSPSTDPALVPMRRRTT